MIDYIKGELAELTPAMAVIEAAGVGYALGISLNTYTAIQGKKDVKLFVHEVLVAGGRDDSYTLFGFASKQERALYRLLISVSGVGGIARRPQQRHCFRQRAPTERRERHWPENRTAHHCRPERQGAGPGHCPRGDHERRRSRRSREQRGDGRGRIGTHHVRLLASTVGQSGKNHSFRRCVNARRDGGERSAEAHQVSHYS